MKYLLGLTVFAASILAYSCGKKNSSSSSSSDESAESISALTITCDGKPCIGTEAE